MLRRKGVFGLLEPLAAKASAAAPASPGLGLQPASASQTLRRACVPKEEPSCSTDACSISMRRTSMPKLEQILPNLRLRGQLVMPPPPRVRRPEWRRTNVQAGDRSVLASLHRSPDASLHLSPDAPTRPTRRFKVHPVSDDQYEGTTESPAFFSQAATGPPRSPFASSPHLRAAVSETGCRRARRSSTESEDIDSYLPHLRSRSSFASSPAKSVVGVQQAQMVEQRESPWRQSPERRAQPTLTWTTQQELASTGQALASPTPSQFTLSPGPRSSRRLPPRITPGEIP